MKTEAQTVAFFFVVCYFVCQYERRCLWQVTPSSQEGKYQTYITSLTAIWIQQFSDTS